MGKLRKKTYVGQRRKLTETQQRQERWPTDRKTTGSQVLDPSW